MALYLNLLVITILASCLAGSWAWAQPGMSLAERLQSNETTTCWESVMEIRSCIGEVLTFFLNGEAYLGPGCCRAVRTIVHDCRPSMLDALGFTAEETHLLDDYCEGEEEAQGGDN
ncbi:hypothetical protein NMG60_11031547 [Bertholletia excelsa]